MFLRLKSARVRIALPYAGLLRIELALDETRIDLAFLEYRVTIVGKNLSRVFEAISQAEATQVAAMEPGPFGSAGLKTAPFVSEIRIEPLGVTERRRR